jgi:hypothetical protein
MKAYTMLISISQSLSQKLSFGGNADIAITEQAPRRSSIPFPFTALAVDSIATMSYLTARSEI